MNSATELAELFEKLRDVKGAVKTAAVSDAWARCFNTAPSSSDFYIALAAVQAKADRAEADIKSSNLSERTRALVLSAISQLRPYVSGQSIYTLHLSNIAGAQPQIDTLFMAGEALPEFLVPDINPLTLDALISEIDELIVSAQAASLDPQFLNLVVRHLKTLLVALRSYDVLGPDGAAKIYGSAAAELARLSGSQLAKAPEARGIASRALNVCKKVGAAVIFAGAVVSGAHELLTDGSDLLGIESAEVNGKKD